MHFSPPISAPSHLCLDWLVGGLGMAPHLAVQTETQLLGVRCGKHRALTPGVRVMMVSESLGVRLIVGRSASLLCVHACHQVVDARQMGKHNLLQDLVVCLCTGCL